MNLRILRTFTWKQVGCFGSDMRIGSKDNPMELVPHDRLQFLPMYHTEWEDVPVVEESRPPYPNKETDR